MIDTDDTMSVEPGGEETLGRASRWKWKILAARLTLIVGLLVAWEVFSGVPGDRFVLIDEFYVSQPSAMVDSIQSWIERGLLWSSIYVTLYETLFGFAIGAVLGMLLGFLLGTSRWISEVLNPIISALYAVPRLALIPLFLLWFGLGSASKIALVATVVFFLVFFNTYSGVRDVNQELIDVLRVMRAKRRHIHMKVTIPSAMVWIIAGLRVSIPYALVGAVTGEMIASNRGLGYLIIRSSGQFNTAGVFGGIVVVMVMALLLSSLVSLLERRLLAWKPRREGQALGP